jgi:hypothetical protein
MSLKLKVKIKNSKRAYSIPNFLLLNFDFANNVSVAAVLQSRVPSFCSSPGQAQPGPLAILSLDTKKSLELKK